MIKQRRTFSAEFKREAAGLVLDQGYSHIEASRSLEVMESAPRRWVSQLQQERNGVTPQSKALTPEQQKIQELEARIARLEREKSILKKATALLMSEEQVAVGMAVTCHPPHRSVRAELPHTAPALGFNAEAGYGIRMHC